MPVVICLKKNAQVLSKAGWGTFQSIAPPWHPNDTCVPHMIPPSSNQLAMNEFLDEWNLGTTKPQELCNWTIIELLTMAHVSLYSKPKPQGRTKPIETVSMVWWARNFVMLMDPGRDFRPRRFEWPIQVLVIRYVKQLVNRTTPHCDLDLGWPGLGHDFRKELTTSLQV